MSSIGNLAGGNIDNLSLQLHAGSHKRGAGLGAIKKADPALAQKIGQDIQKAAQSAKSSGSNVQSAIQNAIKTDLQGASSADKTKLNQALGTQLFGTDGSLNQTVFNKLFAAPTGPSATTNVAVPTQATAASSDPDGDGDTGKSINFVA